MGSKNQIMLFLLLEIALLAASFYQTLKYAEIVDLFSLLTIFFLIMTLYRIHAELENKNSSKDT